MSGQVIVLPPEEYNAWYEAEGAKVKQAAAQASPAAAAPAAQDKPV
jgi:heme/copper-type cytochrome/quinol oxidase subunit 2